MNASPEHVHVREYRNLHTKTKVGYGASGQCEGLGRLVFWFLIAAVLAGIILFFLSPTFVMVPNGDQMVIDNSRLFGTAVVIGLIAAFVAWLWHRM